MAERHIWTPEEDAMIQTLRDRRAGWETIGRALGLSKHTVINRGHRVLGLPHSLPKAHSTRAALSPIAQRMSVYGPEPLPANCGVVDLNAGLTSFS